MGSAPTKSCDKDTVGMVSTHCPWYGFEVLTTDCRAPPPANLYGVKKIPNVYMITTIVLAVLLLMIVITRVRGPGY